MAVVVAVITAATIEMAMVGDGGDGDDVGRAAFPRAGSICEGFEYREGPGAKKKTEAPRQSWSPYV